MQDGGSNYISFELGVLFHLLLFSVGNLATFGMFWLTLFGNLAILADFACFEPCFRTFEFESQQRCHHTGKGALAWGRLEISMYK